MSYRDGVAVGESAKGEDRLDLRVFAIRHLSLVGTNDVANSLLAPTWRDRCQLKKWKFPHAVLLVGLPADSSVSGDSAPSLRNWLYATPSDTDPLDSHLPGHLGVGDHYGTGIVALRSDGGILFLPHGGEWDVFYPDSNTARVMVLDGRNPAFVRWILDNFRCYHALSLHPNDIDVTTLALAEVAVASRWRKRLILQNVGPNPSTTPAVVATDPPIRLYTTTGPTGNRGIILYPRDTLDLRAPDPMVAQAWQAVAIGADTKCGRTAFV